MDLAPSSASYMALRENIIPQSTLSLRDSAEFYEPIPISEKLVQAIWSEQLINSAELKTQSGKAVQVLHPGLWNVEGGPDFRDATLRIDGREISGDIEIHLHANDWHHHQHESNPAYNQVILDVTLWGSENAVAPRTSSGKNIEQLILSQFIPCSLAELSESLDPDRYPFSRKRTRFPAELPIPKNQIAHYIESAGLFRLEQKSKRFASYISELGESQCAYEGLAEAFGYKHNKLAFRRIAEICPLEGMLNLTLEEKIRTLIEASSGVPLRKSQLRPANHPERRLAALGIMMDQHPDLAAYFKQLLENSVYKELPKIDHPFWSFHYHQRGKTLSQPIALLGRDRWCEILTNVIVPFYVAADNRSKSVSERKKLAESIWHKLSPSQSNLAIRFIAFELGLKPPRNVLQQQGLMQLYQDLDLFITDAPPRAVAS